MTRIRVLLVDDHEMVGEGLASLLRPEFEVIGPLRDGLLVPDAVEKEQPDVLMLDLSLPGRNGLDLIPDIRRLSPATKILIVTMHADYALAKSALQLGAHGFIPKDADPAELRNGLERVLAGEEYLSPLIDPQTRRRTTRSGGDPFAHLTKRQLSILSSIGAGRSAQEIADMMGVTINTIYFHRRNLRRQLGVHSEEGLARLGLIYNLGRDAK